MLRWLLLIEIIILKEDSGSLMQQKTQITTMNSTTQKGLRINEDFSFLFENLRLTGLYAEGKLIQVWTTLTAQCIGGKKKLWRILAFPLKVVLHGVSLFSLQTDDRRSTGDTHTHT